MYVSTTSTARQTNGYAKVTRGAYSSSNSTLALAFFTATRPHDRSASSRDSPIYGFYILNRLGTGDYSRRIYPEDDVEILGNYLMYRYYSDYTQKRLASGLPYPLPPQVRPVFDAEFAKDKSLPDEPETPVEPGKPPKEKKGTSMTIGLWQFPQDGRVESLKDVMPR